MSDTLKISGKRFNLPEDSAAWKFESRPGGWVIATDASGKRHRLLASEIRGKFAFSIQTASGQGEILTTERGATGTSQASIDADLTAQFPGKVRKILVSAGTQVSEGDPLILVEAMKMEFVVKAPVSGKIKQIRVKEGQQLSPGDRFVDIEPDSKNAK